MAFSVCKRFPPSRAGEEPWLPELPLKSVSCRESELPPSGQDWAPCPENAEKEVTSTEGLLRDEPVSVFHQSQAKGLGESSLCVAGQESQK